MKKTFYFLMISQPIIDILTSMSVRYFPGIINIGQLFRTFTLVFLTIYLFFYSKKTDIKYNRKIIYFLILFSLLFLINRFFVLDKDVIYELPHILKYNYILICSLGFLNMLRQEFINKKDIEKIMFINLILIFLVILISYVTRTSFNSYYHEESGIVGWFYSANELSAIVVVLMIFCFFKIKKSFYHVILYLIIFWTFIQIGTKTAVYGLFFPPIIYIIYSMICEKNRKTIITPIIILFLSFLIINVDRPLVKDFTFLLNQNQGLKNNDDKHDNHSSIIVEDPDNAKGDEDQSISDDVSSLPNKTKKNRADYFLKELFNKLNKVLSNRLEFLKNVLNIYKKQNILTKFLGIGYISKEHQFKDIEMDLFSILFRFGILGFTIFATYIILIFRSALLSIKNKETFKSKYKFIISFFVAIAFGLIFGHVYLSPSVSIYIAILGSYILFENNKINKGEGA